MKPYSLLTVADKLALILGGLARAVAASSDPRRPGGPLAGWLIMLVWSRVMQTERRIQLLLARFLAGKLRVRTAVAQVGPVRTRQGGKRGGAVKGVPQHLAWLLPLVPCQAANFACQLRLALAEPELVGLLSVSAQARRLLAPLCRMLGIEAALLTPVVAVPSETVDRAAAGAPRCTEPGPETIPLQDRTPSWISQIAWMEKRAVGPPD